MGYYRLVHTGYLSSPCEARAFYELRRYHTRPSRLKFLEKFQAQLFYVLRFSLWYQKMVKKRPEVEKTPENGQNISPTFWTSHITTNAWGKFLI